MKEGRREGRGDGWMYVCMYVCMYVRFDGLGDCAYLVDLQQQAVTRFPLLCRFYPCDVGRQQVVADQLDL